MDEEQPEQLSEEQPKKIRTKKTKQKKEGQVKPADVSWDDYFLNINAIFGAPCFILLRLDTNGRIRVVSASTSPESLQEIQVAAEQAQQTYMG